MGGGVIQAHVDRGAVRAGRPVRSQRRPSVVDALAPAVDAPHLVVADGVAAVEVGAPVGGWQPIRPTLFGPAGARGGADPQGPELVERKGAVRPLVDTYSIRASLTSNSVSGDSFQVFVRWKEIPRRASKHRRASRLIRTDRALFLRR